MDEYMQDKSKKIIDRYELLSKQYLEGYIDEEYESYKKHREGDIGCEEHKKKYISTIRWLIENNYKIVTEMEKFLKRYVVLNTQIQIYIKTKNTSKKFLSINDSINKYIKMNDTGKANIETKNGIIKRFKEINGDIKKNDVGKDSIEAKNGIEKKVKEINKSEFWFINKIMLKNGRQYEIKEDMLSVCLHSLSKKTHKNENMIQSDLDFYESFFDIKRISAKELYYFERLTNILYLAELAKKIKTVIVYDENDYYSKNNIEEMIIILLNVCKLPNVFGNIMLLDLLIDNIYKRFYIKKGMNEFKKQVKKLVQYIECGYIEEQGAIYKNIFEKVCSELDINKDQRLKILGVSNAIWGKQSKNHDKSDNLTYNIKSIIEHYLRDKDRIRLKMLKEIYRASRINKETELFIKEVKQILKKYKDKVKKSYIDQIEQDIKVMFIDQESSNLPKKVVYISENITDNQIKSLESNIKNAESNCEIDEKIYKIVKDIYINKFDKDSLIENNELINF